MTKLERISDQLGYLTHPETEAVAREALSLLGQSRLFDLITSVLSEDEKEELAARWGYL